MTVPVTSVLNEAPVQYFVLLPVLLSTQLPSETEGGEAKAANPDQAIGEADTLTRPVCSDQKCESLDYQLNLLLAQEEGEIKSLITTQLQKRVPTLFQQAFCPKKVQNIAKTAKDLLDKFTHFCSAF